MILKSRTVILPALLVILVFPIATRADSLGRLLGTFTLDAPRAALAKPGASTTYSLPPEGQRQQAMATVTNDFDPQSLDAYGWRLINLYKGIATLEGNPVTLRLLYDAAGILEIHPARTVGPTMDAARRLSRVDGILNWGPTPNKAGVNGKGVIIGLVDFGFEILHPALLDAQGKTRFLGIWDPNLPKEKGAPYGRGQVRNAAQLQAQPTFALHDADFHGTHVASCAGGSQAAYPYYGVAPEASFLGVNLSTQNPANDFETNVVNGVQWIFHVADSLKMPAVVNLSLGNAHAGPHDGTAMFDRFLDSIAAPGHIIIGAAGNDGLKRLHMSLNLGVSDTLGAFTGPDAFLDMWGEAGKNFKFQVLLLDSASKDYTTSSIYLSTATLRLRPIFDTIAWTNPRTHNTLKVAVTVQTEKANAGNGRPHAELVLAPAGNPAPADVEGLRFGFRMVGPGLVHLWNAASTAFLSMGITGFHDGDSVMSISEIGGTAKSILSVGAYVAQDVYTDYKGVAHTDLVNQKVGELASWSSRGPTLDGRVKPELIAPGRSIIGALSSAVTHLADWQYPWIAVWPDPNLLTGRYLAAEGTSQAAPIVAGAVALLLESNPKLTGAQIKSYLTETAYKDEFTGDLTAPNSSWGYGKLDASAAIQKVRPTPVPARYAAAGERKVSARLDQGNLVVTGLEGAGPVEGGIVDWRGREVAGLRALRAGRMTLAKPLRPGVYIAVLKAGRSSYRLRLFQG